MTCDSVSKLIPLYYYGELTPEEEDRLDEHLPECATCAAGMERQRALAAALDRRRVEVPPLLMEECRADLMMAISGAGERVAAPKPPAKSAWTLFLEALNISAIGLGRMRQPAAAFALLAVAFVVGRYSDNLLSLNRNAVQADVFNTVRSLNTDNAGLVHVTYAQTGLHEIVGRPDDPNIQKFLVAGARGENAAVRVESVGLLSNRGNSQEAIDSLLNAAANDPVDGVRLRALEALKPLAGDPRVTKTLSQMLMTDANPTVRLKVIDLMMAHRDDSVVGLFQKVVQREDDSNVRQKASKALKEWNASPETF
jgi:hypothetical protein